jgi:hypothetical protein
MMLRVAFDCLPLDDVPRVPTVFASRYGDLTVTVELLESLAKGEPLAANRFSHSVHNTQAGLFSIVAANRRKSTAVAAGGETFPCAFLEALGMLGHGNGEKVLLVVGDEPLPPVFRRFTDDPVAAYAAGFLLARAEHGPDAISLELGAGEPGAKHSWPQALEFLRWFLSEKSSLTLGSDERGWTWRRDQRAEAVASSR